jgi:branched-chain amino acid transport system ATP-binding protein
VTALRFDTVHAGYGPYKALNGLSLEIGDGDSVALLGRNGAGKSTVARVASGIVPIESGTVEVLGIQLHKTPAHTLARLGVVHLPEGVGLFTGLTVEENLVLRVGGRTRADRRARLARAFELLPPSLRDRRRARAAHLSGGQQRIVAVSAAVAAQPKLLLADEPALGLAPAAAADVYEALHAMHTGEMALVVIETRLDRVRELCARAIVLDRGTVACDVPMTDEETIRGVLLRRAPAASTTPSN